MTWPGVTFRTELPEVVRKELERFAAHVRTQLKAQSDGGVTNTDPLQPIGGAYDLDYLGSYASRVYNDGDIVIGPDGIAYVCIKDGVTTPPDPWPGVGIASSQGPPGPMGPQGPPGPAGTEVLDATYWIASAHAKLLAARNIGALANGYVKHTAGNPYTVAVIPLAEGGTGATTAPQARTNLGLGSMAVQNASAVAITGGTITADDLVSTGRIYAATTINAAGGIGAAFFSGDGSNITNINASLLTHGTVATARLGSGPADATTYLRGDQTWAAAPGVPRGLIAMFASACPVGWTRVAALDGRFPRGAAGWGGTGGADTHSHGVNGGTGGGGSHRHFLSVPGSGSAQGRISGRTYFANQTVGAQFASNTSFANAVHDHNFDVDVNLPVSVTAEGSTADDGNHSHSVNIQSDAVSHLPPWFDVVFCSKD